MEIAIMSSKLRERCGNAVQYVFPHTSGTLYSQLSSCSACYRGFHFRQAEEKTDKKTGKKTCIMAWTHEDPTVGRRSFALYVMQCVHLSASFQ